MSTQSWRTVGGTQNYTQLNNMNMTNITTETLTVRKSYIGLFAIDGYLKVYDNSYFYNYVLCYSDVFIYGNTHQCDKLYLGCNDIMYLYGTDNGVGLNTMDPLATYHIRDGNDNILMLESTKSETENYLSLNSYDNTVSTGSDKESAYINFYDTNQYVVPDSTIYSMHGNLYVNTDNNVIIESRMVISNKSEIQEHFDVENLTVYGTANRIFEYGIYGNIFAYTGTSITAITPTNQSTTFITLNTQSKQGIGIGGGVLNTNNNITFGTIGTYDSSGIFIMSQSFASAKTSQQYLTKKSTVGYNKSIPEIGYYVVDVNGPLRIQMSELNNVNLSSFEFKYIKFCETQPLYGIAVGSPTEDIKATSTSNKFKQYIVYTTNGGITWYNSRVKNTSSLDDLEDGIFYFYSATYKTADFVVISGNNNYMYYSTDYGSTWIKYKYYKDYVNFVVEDTIQTISTTSSYIKGNVIFGGYYNDDSYLPYDRGIYCFIPDSVNGTLKSDSSYRYKITPFTDSSDITFTCITEGKTDNSIMFLANDSLGSYLFDVTYDFSENNFVYQYPLNSTFFNGETFKHYYRNDRFGQYLVGSSIYYVDRGGNWVKSSFEVPSNVTINWIEPIDSKLAVAVGTGGTFIYTRNSGADWDYVPIGILNAYGNANVILDSGLNLLQIHSYDIDTYIISYVSNTYSYGSSLGESKIYQCYIPTLFNRDHTYLLDVCGSVRVAGTFNVVDGANSFMDGALYVQDEIKGYTTLSITGEKTNYNYIGTFGSIANPAEQISEGTVRIQGQNGMGSYNTWNLSVGVMQTEQSEYDTKRLRIIDQTLDATERMTIDQYGYVGIATSTPVSTLDISGITTVSDVTNTSSPTSGALQVYGGVGIIKDLYTGGYTYTTNDAIIYKDEYVYGNSHIYGNISTTSPTTGTLLVTGGVGVSGSISTAGNITVFDDTNTTSPYSGALLVTGGVGVSGSISTAGNITIFDDTNTTSPTTGALLVTGGVGVSGSIYTAGNITIFNTTPSTNSYNGALIVAGGVGVTGNINIQNNIDAEGTIKSHTGIIVYSEDTNTDYYIIAGSIDSPDEHVSQGTLGVQGQNGMGEYSTWKFKVGTIESGTSDYDTTRLRIVDETNSAERMTIDEYGYIGIGTKTPSTLLDVSGITTISCTEDASSNTTGALRVSGGMSIQKSLYVGTDSYMTTNTIYDNEYVYGNVIVYSNIDSTSATTGAFIINGGVGITGSIYSAGNITVLGNTATTSPYNGTMCVTGGIGVNGGISTAGNITIFDTTETISSTTGALIVSGGVGIEGGISTAGNITVFDNTASTSYYTGAVIITGGLGIAGNINIHTNQNVEGIINAETGITVKTTTSHTDNYIIAGSIDDPETTITQGTLGIQGQNGMGDYNTWKFKVGTIESLTAEYDTKRLRIVDETQDYAERMTIDQYGYIGLGTTAPTTLLDISGVTTIRCDTDASGTISGALQVYGGTSISKKLYVGDSAIIGNTIEAISTTSAALQVYGGIGVQKNIYTAGNIIICATESATSIITGALQVSGGIGITGSVYTGGNITITDTTESTSTTTGALQVGGGVGITNSVNVGGNLYINENQYVYGVGNYSQNIIIAGNVLINDTTASTSTTTGALIVAGGVAIQGNLTIADTYITNDFIATSVEITGSDSGTDYSITVGSITNPDEIYTQGTVKIQGQNGLDNYSSWCFSVGSLESGTATYNNNRLRIIDNTNNEERMTIDTNGYVGINTTTPQYTLDVDGYVNVGATDDSTSTTTGALLVGGGAGITGSIYVGGNVVSSGTISGIGYFSSLTVTGDIVYSSTTIATSDGSGSMQTTGGLYVAKNAYMTGNVVIGDSTDSSATNNGSLVLNGGLGVSKNTFIGGNLYVTNTTDNSITTYGSVSIGGSIVIGGNIFINSTSAAYSTSTGALQIDGGMSVIGNIYLGGEIYADDIITSAVGVEVTGSDSGTDYYVLVGSISSPDTIYTQGTLYIQGQNGLDNYSRWGVSVGAYESSTSTYDTTRLRITDTTNSAERMTIDSNGYVGINETEPTTMLYVGGDATITGNLTVSSSMYAASYTTTSDYRIKKFVKELTYEDEITTENLRPVKYYNTVTEKEDIGLIAHEVQELYPFMVNGEKDGDMYQSINYNNIIIALINDVKILREELNEVKTDLLKMQGLY